MTLEEAAGIVTLIFFNYPDTTKGMSDQARITYTRQWHTFFAEDDAKLVEAAVRSFILGSTERFAPNVGQIREQMRKMTVPAGMSEAEAWGLVKNALRNGSYGYMEEFAKLPPMVQRCVGSATQIREWAQMDSGEVDSVVASNFMRSYRAVARREEEYQRLPAGFRQEMGQITGQIFRPMLQGGQDGDE
jgi:hypothetical protein